MSKKNSIIVIILIFILILGLLLFFYFSNNGSTPKQGPTTTTEPNKSPFGGASGDKTFSTTSNPNGTNYYDSNKKLATLRQIYAYPNSGSIILTDKKGNTTIKLVDRATGNIHEATPDSEEVKRVTNTLVPKILEAVWFTAGENLILRYSKENDDTVDNYLAKIKTISSTSNEFSGELTGKVVYQKADSIITNPSGNKSFAVIKSDDSAGSYGLLSSLDSTSNKQIFESVVSEWLVSWPKDNVITFTTKPSYKYPGYLYFFDINTNSFDRIIGNIFGMTTLTKKDLSSLVYSDSYRGTVRLNYFDIKSGIDKNLQIETLSDKCVWGNKNTSTVYCAVPKYVTPASYPDAWYQGTVSFSDNLWKIDTEKGTTDMLFDTDESGIDVDAMDLRISADDKYLVFTDKNDLSLWGLKME